jgi:hypothetical protein
MIAVGRCSNSNGLLFYNPANGTFVSSIDYKFQAHTPSGAHFGFKYHSGTFLYRLDETTSIFALKFAIDSSVYVHTHFPPSITTIVCILTYNSPNIYTVAFKDGSLLEYTENLLSTAPEHNPINQLLGFRGVLMQYYFLMICPNLDKAPCNCLLMIFGLSILENLNMVLYFQFLQQIVSILWIPLNFLKDMPNSRMYMMLALN